MFAIQGYGWLQTVLTMFLAFAPFQTAGTPEDEVREVQSILRRAMEASEKNQPATIDACADDLRELGFDALAALVGNLQQGVYFSPRSGLRARKVSDRVVRIGPESEEIDGEVETTREEDTGRRDDTSGIAKRDDGDGGGGGKGTRRRNDGTRDGGEQIGDRTDGRTSERVVGNRSGGRTGDGESTDDPRSVWVVGSRVCDYLLYGTDVVAEWRGLQRELFLDPGWYRLRGTRLDGLLILDLEFRKEAGKPLVLEVSPRLYDDDYRPPVELRTEPVEDEQELPRVVSSVRKDDPGMVRVVANREIEFRIEREDDGDETTAHEGRGIDATFRLARGNYRLIVAHDPESLTKSFTKEANRAAVIRVHLPEATAADQASGPVIEVRAGEPWTELATLDAEPTDDTLVAVHVSGRQPTAFEMRTPTVWVPTRMLTDVEAVLVELGTRTADDPRAMDFVSRRRIALPIPEPVVIPTGRRQVAVDVSSNEGGQIENASIQFAPKPIAEFDPLFVPSAAARRGSGEVKLASIDYDVSVSAPGFSRHREEYSGGRDRLSVTLTSDLTVPDQPLEVVTTRGFRPEQEPEIDFHTIGPRKVEVALVRPARYFGLDPTSAGAPAPSLLPSEVEILAPAGWKFSIDGVEVTKKFERAKGPYILTVESGSNHAIEFDLYKFHDRPLQIVFPHDWQLIAHAGGPTREVLKVEPTSDQTPRVVRYSVAEDARWHDLMHVELANAGSSVVTVPEAVLSKYTTLSSWVLNDEGRAISAAKITMWNSVLPQTVRLSADVEDPSEASVFVVGWESLGLLVASMPGVDPKAPQTWFPLREGRLSVPEGSKGAVPVLQVYPTSLDGYRNFRVGGPETTSGDTRITSKVEGLVLDSQTGNPVSGANVRRTIISDGIERSVAARTESDGKFSFGMIPYGRYRLEVSRADFETRVRTIHPQDQSDYSTILLDPVASRATKAEIKVVADWSGNIEATALEIEAGGTRLAPSSDDDEIGDTYRIARFPSSALSGDVRVEVVYEVTGRLNHRGSQRRQLAIRIYRDGVFLAEAKLPVTASKYRTDRVTVGTIRGNTFVPAPLEDGR